MKKNKNPQRDFTKKKKKENKIPQSKLTKMERQAKHIRMMEEARKKKENYKRKRAERAQMVPNTLELRSRTLARSTSTI